MERINSVEARIFFLEIAPQAGNILNRWFRSGDLKVSYKAPSDIVTSADLESQEFIATQIRKKFPSAVILGEEDRIDNFDDFKDLENLVVIDPLDGTANFSRGSENFGVSIALVHEGLVSACVVYIPRRELSFWADDNTKGAYLIDKKGKQGGIFVSNVSRIEEASVAFDWPPRPNTGRDRTYIYLGTVIKEPIRQILSLGSAVSDLCKVACGELDAYINCGLSPWDVTPSFIVVSAGGRRSTPRGKSHNIFEKDILASNGKIHDLLIQKFLTLNEK